MAETYDADVVVIGSGAIGANAAYELARLGKSVIILEAGSRIPRWKILENFRNSPRKNNFNDPFPDARWAGTSMDHSYLENTGSFDYRPGMVKVVGGTTWHWVSACWRFLPNDMKMASVYGRGRDWPISYDDLEPWYCRAEEALGVVGDNESDQSGAGGDKPFPPRSKPYPLQPEGTMYFTQRTRKRLEAAGFNFVHEPNARVTAPYDGRPQCCGNNNCMPVCPIGAMYSGIFHVDHAVNAGAKLLTESTAYKLEKGEGNKIVAVHYRKPDGSDHRITARYFIVAAHAFETPKLLLMSDVANSSDQVGRNLMDHTGMGMFYLADEPLWPGRGAQQQGGFANFRDGPHRMHHSAFRHQSSTWVPNYSVAENLISQGIFGKELDRRIRHDAARWVEVVTYLEELPNPANTVRPHATRRDGLGLPTLTVNYNVSNYIHDAAPHVLSDYDKMVQTMGGTYIRRDNGLQNRDHVMGSVIMGENPKDSVVNSDCRTFDHHNLFLATTGVIPAAATVNPTLTGVALAIRAANIIAREI